jgi:Kdo2-lipid IVA lauroyltransferase/acyltransferase
MLLSKKVRRRFRDILVYFLVKSFINISGVLPRKAFLNFFTVLGYIANAVASNTRNLIIKHLTLAFPEKSHADIRKLAKRNFIMLAKNAGEILRSTQATSLRDFDKIVKLYGLEHYEAANAKGKGVIFLASHLGAFDLQVTVMAMRGLKTSVVGTPLKNKRLNKLLWRHRNMHGTVAIERGRETFKMIKVLKSGGSLALLIDQDTKVKSCFVNFFGMPASTPIGAALLALKTGAAVVPIYIYLGDDNLQHMHMLPEIPLRISGNEEADIHYNTQIFTNFIEAIIREHPDQWVWMHERWKTKDTESAMSSSTSQAS